ncbi:MAG: Glycosyl transferase family 1 [Promethearchaeota archaeon]|nr:MAG: Glycosyl transferase family 1 [Candidatus Lokiarchaeota archaeon]
MAKHKFDIGFFTCMYHQVNGTAHAVRFLADAIARLGHNVHLFAPKIINGYNHPETLHFHSIGGVRVSPSTGFVLSIPVRKYFKAQAEYLDVSHIHTHATIGSMGLVWAKKFQIPIIGTHNSPLHYYSAQYAPIIGDIMVKSKFFWFYEKNLLKYYDLLHVPTQSKKELIKEHKFKEPIFCMTNGIHDMYFSPLKQNGIREKYGLEDKKILLYASRLSPEKHQVKIIKAFEEINKVVPDTHLVLVGSDGPSTTFVKSLLSKKKYNKIISYLGIVPFRDLLRLYNTADLSCLWSWVEAEGLVLLEAMAQGTPTVGTNACGIKDVIRHNKTGYLADNLNEFKHYVIRLFKDDDLRKQFGENAKKIAQNYRISNIAKNWIQLYRFTIDQLHPLKLNNIDRNYRVELVKDFVKKLPIVSF